MSERSERNLRPQWRRKLALLASALAGAALVAGGGCALMQKSLGEGDASTRSVSPMGWHFMSFAEGLARLSYDLHFLLRGPVAVPQEVCLVYVDENAGRALQQTQGIWNRHLYAQLIRRLTQERARGVFFDVVFADPSPDPAADEELAGAIAENGRVILGAALELDQGLWGNQEHTIPPLPALRRAAAGWGYLAFRPVDPDYAVRRLYPGTERIASATWRAAVKFGAPLVDRPEERTRERWMSYYGPANGMVNMGFERALWPEATPPGFFRDRVVFIGGRSTITGLMLGKDEFTNPYGRIGNEFSKGVEVHATAYLNLARGEWLTRLSPPEELWLAMVGGVFFGAILPLFAPHRAALLALCGVVGIIWWGQAQFTQHGRWCAWCIPAFVQAPLGLLWALGARYFLEERRRKMLKQAFGLYLSPHMADRIADAGFDLKPGGELVEATVMFTDLEGFTTLSERLDDPRKLSAVLTEYFTRATGHILDANGTVIKYIGDAVMAVWNAPLRDPEHALAAAQVALRLQSSCQDEILGHHLKTRVGLHTGTVLAGNLGSRQRFDYSVIGDAANVASRLEGLNKWLGTEVLISSATCAALRGRLTTRPVGDFRLLGKSESMTVCELLAKSATESGDRWLGVFQAGLSYFVQGAWAEAREAFSQVDRERPGGDPPSRFYLKKIDLLAAAPLLPDWNGVINLTDK